MHIWELKMQELPGLGPHWPNPGSASVKFTLQPPEKASKRHSFFKKYLKFWNDPKFSFFKTDQNRV